MAPILRHLMLEILWRHKSMPYDEEQAPNWPLVHSHSLMAINCHRAGSGSAAGASASGWPRRALKALGVTWTDKIGAGPGQAVPLMYLVHVARPSVACHFVGAHIKLATCPRAGRFLTIEHWRLAILFGFKLDPTPTRVE